MKTDKVEPAPPRSASIARVCLPAPHTGQLRVLRESRRFNFLSAGRRWRKTTLCVSLATRTALEGGRVLWTSPTFEMSQTAWDEAMMALGGTNGARSAFWISNSRLEVGCKFSQGRIWFRSLNNPNSVRGKTADLVVVDEAGEAAAEAWPEVLRPMLMDTGGAAWIVGTPKGRNWFYEHWKRASDRNARYGAMSDSAAWQIPAYGVRIEADHLERDPHPYENPNLTMAEMVSVFEDQTVRRFRQEILAEFIEDGGEVFRNVEACCTVSPEQMVPRPGNFIISADWGKSNDFTVFIVYDVRTGAVVDMDRFNHIGWTVQLNRLCELYLKWKKAGAFVSIVVEGNSLADPLVEALRQARTSTGQTLPVTPFMTTQLSKEQMIEHLQLSIERGRMAFPRPSLMTGEHYRVMARELREELLAYTAERLPSGRIRYGAPEGKHDDIVMALAIAAFAARPPEGTMDPMRTIVPKPGTWSSAEDFNGRGWGDA